MDREPPFKGLAVWIRYVVADLRKCIVSLGLRSFLFLSSFLHFWRIRRTACLGLEERQLGAAHGIIASVCLLTATIFLWAWLTEIDEVTRGAGRVMPSSKTQLVQSGVSGIVNEILVQAGQRVSKGTLLMRLDDTSASANLGERKARAHTLEAQIQRLKQEQKDSTDPYVCPVSVADSDPDICLNESYLMDIRLKALETRKSMLQAHVVQRKHELEEAHSNRVRVEAALILARRELDLLTPLAERQVVSELDLIRARRALSDLEGESKVLLSSIGRLEAGLRETELRIQEEIQSFRQSVLNEMAQKVSELAGISEAIKAMEDGVKRTDIRSPIDGVVNRLDVNTTGAVLMAGTRVMDIVPLGGGLLIEARIRPSDIAFVRLGQQAIIKVTAYDFSIFGGVEGQVKSISPDTLYDEQTKETYYSVMIESKKSAIDHNGKDYPIFPGMLSQINILTGRRNILSYLTEPVSRLRQEALREG